MSRTVLVTGGAGFIGSHVAEALVASGHRVLIVDDEATIVRLFKMLLEFDLPGKQIDTACNGAEAIENPIVGKRPIDHEPSRWGAKRNRSPHPAKLKTRPGPQPAIARARHRAP